VYTAVDCGRGLGEEKRSDREMRSMTGKADEINMGLDSSSLSLPNATPGLVLIPSPTVRVCRGAVRKEWERLDLHANGDESDELVMN